MIRWLSNITFLATQLTANNRRTAFWRNDPRAINPRRIVACMLKMSTLKLSHPVIFFVLVETDNATFHKHLGYESCQ